MLFEMVPSFSPPNLNFTNVLFSHIQKRWNLGNLGKIFNYAFFFYKTQGLKAERSEILVGLEISNPHTPQSYPQPYPPLTLSA